MATVVDLKIILPIDEMLMDLRVALEAFQVDPGNGETSVRRELRRIENTMDDEIEEFEEFEKNKEKDDLENGAEGAERQPRM